MMVVATGPAMKLAPLMTRTPASRKSPRRSPIYGILLRGVKGKPELGELARVI